MTFVCGGHDHAVVAALRAGDERAFRALVERHATTMRRVARSYVESDAVADEVVQETLAGVVRGIARFEGRSTLSTWIFSILVNQARSQCGRERRMLPLSCCAAVDGESAIDADCLQSDDDPWPGHWATPPMAEAREAVARAGGAGAAARGVTRASRAPARRRRDAGR